MDRSASYDDDILAWSQQQAAALRGLAGSRRDLPNELDLANIAEEIEDLGRSQLNAVESRLRLILLHLVKLACEPQAEAARHWRGEILLWLAEAGDRFAPSMRQRIDIERLWRQALRQAWELMSRPERTSWFRSETCPVPLDRLLDEEEDLNELIALVQSSLVDRSRPTA